MFIARAEAALRLRHSGTGKRGPVIRPKHRRQAGARQSYYPRIKQLSALTSRRFPLEGTIEWRTLDPDVASGCSVATDATFIRRPAKDSCGIASADRPAAAPGHPVAKTRG